MNLAQELKQRAIKSRTRLVSKEYSEIVLALSDAADEALGGIGLKNRPYFENIDRLEKEGLVLEFKGYECIIRYGDA